MIRVFYGLFKNLCLPGTGGNICDLCTPEAERVGHSKFEASLLYIAHSGPARATQQDLANVRNKGRYWKNGRGEELLLPLQEDWDLSSQHSYQAPYNHL